MRFDVIQIHVFKRIHICIRNHFIKSIIHVFEKDFLVFFLIEIYKLLIFFNYINQTANNDIDKFKIIVIKFLFDDFFHFVIQYIFAKFKFLIYRLNEFNVVNDI